MSKGVFINDIETYIGWALFDEFAGEKPEENTEYTIYGTYLNKDSSEKPVGVKKMMKVKTTILIIEIKTRVVQEVHAGKIRRYDIRPTFKSARRYSILYNL